MTEQEFRALCEKHDLTFQYSDDGAVWRKGQAERKALETAAASFPRATAVAIFNAVVDTKIVPESRKAFYWTV